MANNLGSLVVSLGLEASEFTRGLTKSEYESKRTTDSIKSQFAGIASAVAGLGLGTLFVGGIRNAVNYADEMGKLGQKAGITSEEFSGLAYAANAADVSNEQLAKGLRALSKDAGDGGEKLAALGISLDDASGKAKSADQLFSEVAKRFERMPDGIEKTNLAMSIFGDKVGPELIPLLNGGADGIKAMTDEARELGKVIGDDVAKQADEFNDSLDRLKARADGFFVDVAGPIAKGLNTVIGQFELARKYSGSFYESLFRTGTSDAPQRIKDLQEKVKGLNAELKNPLLVGLPRARVEDAIASANKDLGLLGEFQRKAQLEDNARLGAQFGANNPKLASLGARTETYVPTVVADRAGVRTPRGATGKTDAQREAERAEADYQQRLKDYANDQDAYVQARHNKRLSEQEKEEKRYLDDLAQYAADQDAYVQARHAKRIKEQEDAEKDAADRMKKVQEDQAKSLADAFSGSFNRMFTEGMKFGDLLKQLAFDAINIQLLTPATQKIGSSIGSAVSSLFKGISFDGGGYTGNGSRSGGLDGKGGFMAMLHPNETVLDHTRGQGAGGGTVIQQTISIDARGADAGVEQRIRAAMAQTKAETLAAVQAKANRGGSFSSALGRA